MTILNNGGAPVTARGICWSTDRIHYEYVPSTTLTGSDVGTFYANITGLTSGVTYYAKGYATNSAGTSYTSEVSFITASLATITTTHTRLISQEQRHKAEDSFPIRVMQSLQQEVYAGALVEFQQQPIATPQTAPMWEPSAAY